MEHPHRVGLTQCHPPIKRFTLVERGGGEIETRGEVETRHRNYFAITNHVTCNVT